MPFPGAETALAATTGVALMESIIRNEFHAPAASNRVLRIFNDLHEDSTTCTKTQQVAGFAGKKFGWRAVPQVCDINPLCHPERSEGPVHFAGSASPQAGCIGPSLRSG